MLRQAIALSEHSRSVNVIVNFTETSEVDDQGLNTLVLCDARLRQGGGALKLLDSCSVHMSVAALLRLDTVFEVFRNEHDAINSFFPERATLDFDILEFVQEQEKLPSPGPCKMTFLVYFCKLFR